MLYALFSDGAAIMLDARREPLMRYFPPKTPRDRLSSIC